MRIVDVNVLLYAHNEDAPRHRASRAWLEAAFAADEPLGFAWPVILAYLRLATHPAAVAQPLEVADALEDVRSWLAQPAAMILEPTTRHLDVLGGLLTETGTAANLVSDAHLAALAVEYDATVVSFDADFGRYRGVRWQPPSS